MGVREISPILQKKAQEELGEGARDVNEDLALIRDWAAKLPHLQSINLSDQWLISFLRGCKFSLEKTKGKLETFYTMRSLFPQFVTKLDPMSPVMQDLLSRGICLPLPRTKNPDDPYVVLLRTRAADPNNTLDDDLTRFYQLIILNGLMNVDQMVVAGLRLIYDVSKYNADLNIALNVERAKRNMAFNLKALPIRFKGVHLINTSSNTEMIINFVKKFLGEKHNKMLHIHKTLEDLHEYVPRSILPAEYGGDGPTIKELTDKLKKEVEASRDFYLQEEKYKTDESRRPGSPTTLDAILHGTNGSFRQLAVD